MNNQNYFQLFDINPGDEIIPSILNDKLFELQRKFHPDQFVGKDKHEQEVAAEHSARINEAYQTLKDPINYIEYYLRLKNCELSEHKNVVPQEFILSIYEYAEALESAQNELEAKSTLEHLIAEQKQLISQTMGEIRSNHTQKALSNLAKIKYLTSIIMKHKL